MITDDGKEIISKYLLGYIPTYASHIAIGCGARPRTTATMTVSNKKIVSYLATLTTATNHYFKIGEYVQVAGVGTQFNGIYQITDIPSPTQFSYSVATQTLSPASATGTATLYLNNKTTLDFEMARVPIISKGFVDDNGTTKISFIAEVPSENRYEITELGLWSAPNNPLAVNSDSHVIFSFTESWQGHGSSVFDPIIKTSIGTFGNINDNGDKIFYALSSDSNLTTAARKQRAEGHRFLSKTLFVRGDSCQLNILPSSAMSLATTAASGNGTTATLTFAIQNVPPFKVGSKIVVAGVTPSGYNGTYTVTECTTTTVSYASTTTGSQTVAGTIKKGYLSPAAATGETSPIHVHLNNVNFDISNNSPSDLLSLAFCLVDKNGIGESLPSTVKILMEFYRNEISTSNGFAKKEIILDGSVFTDNRYRCVTFPISDLTTSEDFSPATIRVCRIYASVETGAGLSSNHYISFDGLRVDNISTDNPLYKMSGYSIVLDPDAYPITKKENTINYIEFRMNLGVS